MSKEPVAVGIPKRKIKYSPNKVDFVQANVYRKTSTQAEIDYARNMMALGNYPLGMTDCEVVGIQGNCGLECPVFVRGECQEAIEFHTERLNRKETK